MGTKTRLWHATRLKQRPGLLALLLLVPTVGAGVATSQELAPPTSRPAPAGGSIERHTVQQAAAPAVAGPGMTSAAGSPAPARGHRGSVACLIGPERSADIGSAVTGVIAAIPVDRGDSVRRGQVLVRLEQDVERAQLQAASARSAIDAEVRSAEASLALARDRYERMHALADSGAVAALSIEQARAEHDVAQQRLQQALGQRKVAQQEQGIFQAQLAQRSLRAPFDGVIVERMAHEGERVEDKPLLRMAQLHPLRVELVMPAARWGSVRSGDEMPILPDLPAATRLLAKVTHIDRTLDAASNTFRVRLSLPNPSFEIPSGARCRLDAPSEAAVPPPAAPPPVTGPSQSGLSGSPGLADQRAWPKSSAPAVAPALHRAAPQTPPQEARLVPVAGTQPAAVQSLPRPRLKLST